MFAVQEADLQAVDLDVRLTALKLMFAKLKVVIEVKLSAALATSQKSRNSRLSSTSYRSKLGMSVQVGSDLGPLLPQVRMGV